MKMKIFPVILFFVLSVDISARVVPLPEVIRPHDISVDNNQLYIWVFLGARPVFHGYPQVICKIMIAPRLLFWYNRAKC